MYPKIYFVFSVVVFIFWSTQMDNNKSSTES
jgi:hypothetical protein